MIPRKKYFFFFFNDTATTEIYTLSLHDALPISGSIVRASTPYVDGQRVTLLEVDLDQLLKDPDALLARVQAAKTPDQIKAALKDVPGLKMALEREITIAFTPTAK